MWSPQNIAGKLALYVNCHFLWTYLKFLKMWFHFGTCPLGTREILGPPTAFADFLLSFPRNSGLCGLQSPEKLQVLLREHPQPWWVCFLPLCFLQGLWVCKWPSLSESLCGTVVLLGHLQCLTIPYLSWIVPLSLWSWEAEGGKIRQQVAKNPDKTCG